MVGRAALRCLGNIVVYRARVNRHRCPAPSILAREIVRTNFHRKQTMLRIRNEERRSKQRGPKLTKRRGENNCDLSRKSEEKDDACAQKR